MNATCFLGSIMTLIVMVTLSFHGSSEEVDPCDLSMAQLGQIKVYTGSRDLTSFEVAPAVMTFVTAANIRRQGGKTLRDLMISAIYTESPYSQVIIVPVGENQNSFQ